MAASSTPIATAAPPAKLSYPEKTQATDYDGGKLNASEVNSIKTAVNQHADLLGLLMALQVPPAVKVFNPYEPNGYFGPVDGAGASLVSHAQAEVTDFFTSRGRVTPAMFPGTGIPAPTTGQDDDQYWKLASPPAAVEQRYQVLTPAQLRTALSDEQGSEWRLYGVTGAQGLVLVQGLTRRHVSYEAWLCVEDAQPVWGTYDLATDTFAEFTGGPTTPGGSLAWADITGKPTSFPPSAHTHAYADITNKPTTFAPSAHTHAIADTTGLQAALDTKAATSHTHTAANISDFTAAADLRVTAGITALKGGVATDGDTLAKLRTLISGLQAIVGGTAPDGNNVVDTVTEVLALLQNFPEAPSLLSILNGLQTQVGVLESKALTPEQKQRVEALAAPITQRDGSVLSGETDLTTAAAWNGDDRTLLLNSGYYESAADLIFGNGYVVGNGTTITTTGAATIEIGDASFFNVGLSSTNPITLTGNPRLFDGKLLTPALHLGDTGGATLRDVDAFYVSSVTADAASGMRTIRLQGYTQWPTGLTLPANVQVVDERVSTPPGGPIPADSVTEAMLAPAVRAKLNAPGGGGSSALLPSASPNTYPGLCAPQQFIALNIEGLSNYSTGYQKSRLLNATGWINNPSGNPALYPIRNELVDGVRRAGGLLCTGSSGTLQTPAVYCQRFAIWHADLASLDNRGAYLVFTIKKASDNSTVATRTFTQGTVGPDIPCGGVGYDAPNTTVYAPEYGEYYLTVAKSGAAAVALSDIYAY